MNDPYDNGTPKYYSAQSIYDALCELVQTEEMGILQEMFSDVSVENQGYYYTDRGAVLKEKFEEVSDYCNNMWLMDLAVWQIDQSEIHDIVYDCLLNVDMAKRLGFKKLFVDDLLMGMKTDYDEVVEEYAAELGELNRFGFWENSEAFFKVMEARGRRFTSNPYRLFCGHLIEKARGLRLQEECRIISECRALLTSYDDFMLGLRMNQALYQQLQQLHDARMQRLQEGYEKAIRQLFAIAERQGVILTLTDGAKLLTGSSKGE